jgi:hypothetical protein
LSVDSEAHDSRPKFGPPEFHQLIAKFFEIDAESAISEELDELPDCEDCNDSEKLTKNLTKLDSDHNVSL